MLNEYQEAVTPPFIEQNNTDKQCPVDYASASQNPFEKSEEDQLAFVSLVVIHIEGEKGLARSLQLIQETPKLMRGLRNESLR